MPNYRNPNGFGSVVKLSGHRRKPFMVRKTTGWDERAYPVYSIIGYYASRKEAMIALAEYNHQPFDVDLSKITFKELFEKYKETELPRQTESVMRSRTIAFNHCKKLYDLPYKDLRKYHFQQVIDECDLSGSFKGSIRALLVSLDQYAYDLDIVAKQYTSGIVVKRNDEAKEKIVFSDDEVKTLWVHQGEPCIDETLFQLYTGCRVSEMLQMRCENIDLEAGTMRGGVKTEAGKNRVIPIHSKLRPIIEAHINKGELLFNIDCPRNTYLNRWQKAMKGIGLNHTTHECRHTFRTKLDSAGANKVAIDRIMGHKSQDVGERVYTHKTLDELKQAIELLSYGV